MENGKVVDFNDPTQVCRRRSKKRLRISTNDSYWRGKDEKEGECNVAQKLQLLSFIIAADSMGLRSLVFT